MKLDDRLVEKKKAAEKFRKNQVNYEDEETLMYKPYKSMGYINQKSTVFKGFGDEGINNAPSVFDRQALFTSKKEEKR